MNDVSPHYAKRVLSVRLSFLSGDFDKVVFKFYVKIDFCF